MILLHTDLFLDLGPGRPAFNAVGQSYPLAQTEQGVFDIVFFPFMGHLDQGFIFFFVLEFGVGQAVGEVAVVGEQDKPGGVLVQPAHRIKP